MADFVDKIVKDPKNPPATVMLSGYLGSSSEAEHKRLYFDPHLSSYADIPNADILHQQDAKSDDGLQASYVWIKRNAQVIYGSPAADRPKATYLDGQITRDHMAGAGGTAAPQVHAMSTITSSGHLCPTHTPNCNVGVHPQVAAAWAFPTITSMGHLCPSTGCGGGTHPMAQTAAWAFPTITSMGHLCPSTGCGGGTHPMAQTAAWAFPTITSMGHLCPSTGCGGGTHHPMAQTAAWAFPTITSMGHLCPSTGCGGGAHTMAQFMPNYSGQST
jgi:hypothetical protein